MSVIAVLLWEIFHCRCPYSELSKNQMQVLAVQQYYY